MSQRFNYLLIPILGVVIVTLLIGFVFSIYVATEYEKYNVQIRFLTTVSQLRAAISENRDRILGDASGGRVFIGLEGAGAAMPDAVVRALVAGEEKVVIVVSSDEASKIYFKGIDPGDAVAIASNLSEGLPFAASKLPWDRVRYIENVSVDGAPPARFSIIASEKRGRFILDFVANRLWAFVLVLLAIAISIAFGAYRFVRRRYDDVAHERSRLSDFAQSSSDWFWEMDKDLRFSYFSPRFTAVTGVPEERLLGKTREETGNPGATVRDWQEHLESLHQRRPFRNFIHPRTKPDGTTVWLSISGAPAYENGRFAGFRGTGTDITRQRTMERQLRQMKEAAEKANRAKSEFLAAMSHDLRTPLNAILGFADIIRYRYLGPVDDKYREYAEDIHSSGEMLLSLVNEVLDLSAIEAGKKSLNMEALDILEVVEDCRKIVDAKARNAGLTLRATVTGTETFIRSDERALKQILHNLLSNAVKFTPSGGEVEMTVDVTDTRAVFTIRDSGCGMTAQEVATLFEPFVKGGTEPFVTEDGWGLGLSIVNSLVNLLGGSLEIESAVGTGTTFTVTLPTSPN